MSFYFSAAWKQAILNSSCSITKPVTNIWFKRPCNRIFSETKQYWIKELIQTMPSEHLSVSKSPVPTTCLGNFFTSFCLEESYRSDEDFFLWEKSPAASTFPLKQWSLKHTGERERVRFRKYAIQGITRVHFNLFCEYCALVCIYMCEILLLKQKWLLPKQMMQQIVVNYASRIMHYFSVQKKE